MRTGACLRSMRRGARGRDGRTPERDGGRADRASAVRDAAAAPTLAAALEVGYRAFGASACTAAAREGIAAFLERRNPDFGATG